MYSLIEPSFASIVAAEGLKVKTMDIAQVYLNADMMHDLYLQLEPTIAKVLCERDLIIIYQINPLYL